MIMVPITGLFETHLTVGDLDRAIGFYRDVLGLPLAYRVPHRQVAFVWIGGPGKAMLGLWQVESVQRLQLHMAFAVPLEEVTTLPDRLRAAAVTPLDFWNEPAEEPSVFGWMPAAAVFCQDPDGHLIEFVAMLPELPRPELGVVAWSRWRSATDQ
jgi:catechol 2,3-dioxygenase-like lactoylglutathione lyase family enzyme